MSIKGELSVFVLIRSHTLRLYPKGLQPMEREPVKKHRSKKWNKQPPCTDLTSCAIRGGRLHSEAEMGKGIHVLLVSDLHVTVWTHELWFSHPLRGRE